MHFSYFICHSHLICKDCVVRKFTWVSILITLMYRRLYQKVAT